MNNQIPVAEIFGPTIQGEGPNVGIKCIFVRVVGCDFHCEWCDSKFAWRADENTQRYAPEQLSEIIINKCAATHTSKVIITGGNPCLYDLTDVIEKLKEKKISVDIETQGSRFPEWLKLVDTLVISPKAPSSKQKDVYNDVVDFLQKVKEEFYPRGYIIKIAIKIPVFNDEDFQFAWDYAALVQALRNTTNLNIKMYLSVGNTDTSESGSISARVLSDYEKLIDKVMNSNMDSVYILPQMHTLVWGNRQGV